MSRRTYARAHLARCPATGKVRFRDHKEAVKARHLATNARLVETAAGVPEDLVRRRERRDYVCPACGGHHLTSWSSWRIPA